MAQMAPQVSDRTPSAFSRRVTVEGVAAPAPAGRSAGTWARRQRLVTAQRPPGRHALESAGLFPPLSFRSLLLARRPLAPPPKPQSFTE